MWKDQVWLKLKRETGAKLICRQTTIYMNLVHYTRGRSSRTNELKMFSVSQPNVDLVTTRDTQTLPSVQVD